MRLDCPIMSPPIANSADRPNARRIPAQPSSHRDAQQPRTIAHRIERSMRNAITRHPGSEPRQGILHRRCRRKRHL
ncbi:hypothetical protein LshimejAT787_2600150 [Lyophyllum shimeji]|uniref:Uncharacterized protein n=1 Tax=Lyophyllum shimeji TaxID=47721 RepID=A0A9P3PZ00_LYOSH|nr:hypothetical protein LshimejAT787_2600150 [Lyophyllum shimeji]